MIVAFVRKAKVFPVPTRLLDKVGLEPHPGGRYIRVADRHEITGKTFAGGSIKVDSGPAHPVRGSKVTFNVSDHEAAAPGRGAGPTVRANLFKQKAGWHWHDDAPGRNESTVVSVEMRGKHHYAIAAHFTHPVNLARYENSPSEPRLRPTTNGHVHPGEVVGHINVRGRLHPVHDRVVISSEK